MDTTTCLPTSSLPEAIEAAAAEGRLTVAPIGQLFSSRGIPLSGAERPHLVLFTAGERTPRYRGRVRTDAAGTPQWEGAEHTFIGDQIDLQLDAEDPAVPSEDVPLTLANGLRLTYGQVVSLGGDFYGIPDAPISDGDDHEARFRAAYATLAEAPAAVTEAPQILEVMQVEIDAVNAALRNGKSPVGVYDELGNSLNKAWNRITGGGSAVSPWIPEGRYLKLADTNWDHFGLHALVAYTAGHQVALQKAVEASRQSGDAAREAMLLTAYSINAFADHFLSDIFSSGHLRTPRKELYELLTPSAITGLLAKYMHDEDSVNGLYVTNARGDAWKAFGDKRYFDANDAKNAHLVVQALQASADEVFAAYQAGALPAAGDPAAADGPLTYVPDLRQVQDYRDFEQNYSPLFIPKKSTVYERDSFTDLNEHDWTYYWVPASSLARLSWLDHRTNAPAGWLAAPTGAPRILAWTSTTPTPPAWVDGAQVRYAVSFFNSRNQAENESALGPWGEYVTLDGGFKPEISIPVDPSPKATGRKVYRQFAGSYPTFVGRIDNNTATAFVDTSN